MAITVVSNVDDIAPKIMIAKTLDAVRRKIVLVKLFNRKNLMPTDFGRSGDTIHVPYLKTKPTIRRRTDLSQPVDFDASDWGTKPVALTDPYVAGSQISEFAKIRTNVDIVAKELEQQAYGLVEQVETDMFAKINVFTKALDCTTTFDKTSFINARKKLINTPKMNRYMILSDSAYAKALDFLPQLQNNGNGGQTMVNGEIGTYYGFETLESEFVPVVEVGEEGSETNTYKNLALSVEALAFVNKPLPVDMPNSTIATTIVDTESGLSLRQQMWYDANYKSWRMTTEMLCGFEILNPDMGVILTTDD